MNYSRHVMKFRFTRHCLMGFDDIRIEKAIPCNYSHAKCSLVNDYWAGDHDEIIH